MNPIKELSLPNYTALTFLEHLGLSNPSQKQIDIAEAMVSMITYPHEIAPETIRQCVGDDELAYYFLFVKTNEWCKLKGDEVFLTEFENRQVEEEEEVGT